MFESDCEVADQFMDRFELDQDQFATVATFFSIMKHEPEVIQDRPESLKVTRADLEDHRSRVLDQFLYISKAIDRQTIEENGALDPTVSENGVGVFSHERLTRAAIRVFDGMALEEAAARAGVVPEAVECLHDIMTRKLLYMSSLAVKAHPEWTALDVLKSFDDIEQFSEWNDQAFQYLDEDDEEACEREHEIED